MKKNFNFLIFVYTISLCIAIASAAGRSDKQSTPLKPKTGIKKILIEKVSQNFIVKNFRKKFTNFEAKDKKTKETDVLKEALDSENVGNRQYIRNNNKEDEEEFQKYIQHLKKSYNGCYQRVSYLGKLFTKNVNDMEEYSEAEQNSIFTAIKNIKTIENHKNRSGQIKCLVSLGTQFNLIYSNENYSDIFDKLFSCHLITLNLFMIAQSKILHLGAKEDREKFQEDMATLDSFSMSNNGYSYYRNGCQHLGLTDPKASEIIEN